LSFINISLKNTHLADNKIKVIAEAYNSTYFGLAIAVLLIFSWLFSQYISLFILNFSKLPIPLILLLIALNTWFFTGLFITAHDGMHTLISPYNSILNNFIGGVAVRLYALFSFKKLKAKHWLHHNHPVSSDDPDFCEGGFLHWYASFTLTYIEFKQIVGMSLVFFLLKNLLGVAEVNLLAFWVAPALLSTLQLFYFGTYLPHRREDGDYKDGHRARSLSFNNFWSFITCFHFGGKHHEHHLYPFVPWWLLPKVCSSNKHTK
jgi:beta-carotene/zeaxanthin 4-ketolase